MNDLLDAIGSRIRNPYYGYLLIAIIGVNWRELFTLFVSDGKIEQRIEVFDKATSIEELLIIPAVIAAVLAVASIWFSWLFNFLTTFPADKISFRALDSENKLATKRKELEDTRNAIINAKGEAVISQAKKLDEAKEIQDPIAREEAKIALEELDQKRHESSTGPFEDIRLRGMRRIAESHKTIVEIARNKQDFDKAEIHAELALKIEQSIQELEKKFSSP